MITYLALLLALSFALGFIAGQFPHMWRMKEALDKTRAAIDMEGEYTLERAHLIEGRLQVIGELNHVL